MKKNLYIGVMTGNSMDAADAVLLDFARGNVKVKKSASKKMPPALAAELRNLADNGGRPQEFMLAQNKLTKLCAAAMLKLNVNPANIAAVGCHGQTICHNPARGFSWQMINGALLAELTNCNVVCDFRSRDIAAGGEGAPLAPFFHRAVFAKHAPCAVVNIGGIANITIINKNGGIKAFDTGPGNILLDDWHRANNKGAFDRNGKWSQGGEVLPRLLSKWLRHPYFAKKPPKSCGREEFSPANFRRDYKNHNAQNIQRTLLELTAQTISKDAGHCAKIYLCGGGAHNKHLTRRLTELSKAKMRLSCDIGIPPEQMEAAAFAWLAREHMQSRPINTKTITGAQTPRIPGALYPR